MNSLMRFEYDITTGSTVTSIGFAFSDVFVCKICDGTISAFTCMKIKFDLIGKIFEFEFGGGFLLSRDGFGEGKVVLDETEEMSSHWKG